MVTRAMFSCPMDPPEIPGTRDVTLMAYDHEHPVLQEPTLSKRLTLYRPNKEFTSGDVIESLRTGLSRELIARKSSF
ncbi:MAG: hypothetical protein IPI39_12380 [Candidatus Obscuribacter sp.]|nr:hypothetical protein [Candidatus Obscuribacter sp.]